jgi:squalene-hopene/tetraprenyl-beta-curcumene cyclase
MMAPVLAADERLRSGAEVRGAVERSLPYLEREGVAWIEQHDCLSCHHVPLLLWSHNAAKLAGIAVDEVKLTRWGEWAAAKSMSLRGSFAFTEASLAQLREDGVPAATLAQLRPLLGKEFATENELDARLGERVEAEALAAHRNAIVQRAAPPNVPGKTDGGGLDTVAQLLLGRGRGGRGLPARFVTVAPELIVAWQQAGGNWQAAGQLANQNRPPAETDAVATRWAVLALGTLDGPPPKVAQSLGRALPWVNGRGGAGKSTETLITAALIARRFGEQGQAGGRAAELLRMQNDDGGWSWAVGGRSDAFSTGQALYALGLIGAPEAGPSVDRAREYLIQTQQEDGSWPTTGEGISQAATPQRKKKVEPIYRYWGTAWATIGLSSPGPGTKKPAP